jgi:ABC-type microcin C transport system permease subunit YejB
MAAVRAQYGFDRPVIVQYLDYLGGLLRGDLGTSYVRKQPVSDIISQQIASTLTLTITALVAAWVIAVLVTLLTAHRSRPLAALGSGVETLLAAVLAGHRSVGALRVPVALATGGRRRGTRGDGASRTDSRPAAGRLPRPGDA